MWPLYCPSMGQIGLQMSEEQQWSHKVIQTDKQSLGEQMAKERIGPCAKDPLADLCGYFHSMGGRELLAILCGTRNSNTQKRPVVSGCILTQLPPHIWQMILTGARPGQHLCMVSLARPRDSSLSQ